MDFLQVALIFLIALLSILLTVLGIQVFFILKDLKKSLEKFDHLMDSTQVIEDNVAKPVAAVAEVAQAVETGARVVNAITSKIAASKNDKPASKRFFKKVLK